MVIYIIHYHYQVVNYLDIIPLTFNDYNNLLNIKFKYLILCENIPQIIIQIIWLFISNNKFNEIPLLIYISIGLSLINTVSFILQYYFNKINDSDKIHPFKIVLKLSKINDDIKKINYKNYYTNSIRTAILSSQLIK